MKNTIKLLALSAFLGLGSTVQAREFYKVKVTVKTSYTSVSTGTEKLAKSKGYIIRSNDEQGAFCELTLKSKVIPCSFVVNSIYVKVSDISQALCSNEKWCAAFKNAQPQNDGYLDLYPKNTTKVQLHTGALSEAFHIEVKVEKLKKI